MQCFLLRLPLELTEETTFSHILVCRDMEKAKSYLEETYSEHRHIFYEKDEFLLDDAKALIKEAYIAEAKAKYLLVCSKSYRIEAQNALLKILEEPPRNIVFVLCATAKTALLPTIRSRLVLKEFTVATQPKSSDLDLKKLDIAHIYAFAQANQHVDKNDLKEMVQVIVREAIDVYQLRFSERELSYFQTLMHLCELNTRAQTILVALLLAILQRKYQ